MSKIVVKVENAPRLADVMPAIRKITGLGISDAKQRIESGRPLVEYVLFNNDHDEIAVRLRELMTEIPRHGAKLRLFELREDDDFESMPNASKYEISFDVMENTLLRHEEGIQRFTDEDDDET